MSALHIVSSVFGAIFPMLIGGLVLKLLAIAIFFLYGIMFAYEAYQNEKEEEDEDQYKNLD